MTAITDRTKVQREEGPDVMRLMTHPGVGPPYVLIIGTPERFRARQKIGTYVGMIPTEDSSAGKQRLGHISKQGNSFVGLLVGGIRTIRHVEILQSYPPTVDWCVATSICFDVARIEFNQITCHFRQLP